MFLTNRWPLTVITPCLVHGPRALWGSTVITGRSGESLKACLLTAGVLITVKCVCAHNVLEPERSFNPKALFSLWLNVCGEVLKKNQHHHQHSFRGLHISNIMNPLNECWWCKKKKKRTDLERLYHTIKKTSWYTGLNRVLFGSKTGCVWETCRWDSLCL